MKKGVFMLSTAVILLFAVLFTSCGKSAHNSTQDMRRIQDQAGAEVDIPKDVKTIADFFSSNVQTIYMLGGIDRVVSSTQSAGELPWFVKIYPQATEIKNVVNHDDDSVNMEELMSISPDLVISAKELQVDACRNANIPTMYINFTDFESMKESFRLTAQILGGDAIGKAEDYISYLENNVNKVLSVTNSIEESEKPKVFYARSSRFYTDGRNSIVDEWISLCGGINVMHDVVDGKKEITIEEFIAANPDIIIIRGSNAFGEYGGQRVKDDLMNDPALAEVNAIKNHQVYLNPVGIDFWSFYSSELALQVLWASQLFYPDKFAQTDIISEAQTFYKEFFNYEFTDQDIEKMLLQLNPNDILPE